MNAATEEKRLVKALKPFNMDGLKKLHEKLRVVGTQSCFEGLFSLNFEIFEEDMSEYLKNPTVKEVDGRRMAMVNLWSKDEHLFEGHFESVEKFRKILILSKEDRKATCYILFSAGNISAEPFVLLLELSPVRDHGVFGKFIGCLTPY